MHEIKTQVFDERSPSLQISDYSETIIQSALPVNSPLVNYT